MNKSKIKGTHMETRVVKYLVENGFSRAERRALQGSLDKGDIAGVDDATIEVKNEKSFDLARYIDETLTEQRNAGTSVGFCVFPRRNRHIGQAYCLCTFDQMIALIRNRPEKS